MLTSITESEVTNKSNIVRGISVMGATPPPSRLPVIDLSKLDGPQHDRVVESIVDASKRHGWFQVVNHGMPVEFLEELKESEYRFFNQSEEKKAVYIADRKDGPPARYAPGTAVAPVDVLVMTGNDKEYALKHWPDICKEAAVKYQKSAGSLADRILGILLNDLGVKVDESMIDLYMAEKDTQMNYYPIFPNENLEISAAHKHTDPHTLSVLLQDHVGGLFAKLKHGEWVQVEPVPGALIVIVGDSLEVKLKYFILLLLLLLLTSGVTDIEEPLLRPKKINLSLKDLLVISNGKYKAAEHYVQTPGRETRVSYVVHMHPRPTVKIQPLPQVVERDGGKPRYKEFTYEEHYSYLMNNYSPVGFSAVESLRSF